MENRDELEHPLLEENAANRLPSDQNQQNQAPVGLFKGILVKCEEDRAYPPLGWRGYCGHPPELLDACALPRSLESLYPAGPLWGQADLLSKEYLETTFVDIRPGSALERKLLAEAQDFHSAPYSMDDEDDLLPDSDVRKKKTSLSEICKKIVTMRKPSAVWSVAEPPVNFYLTDN